MTRGLSGDAVVASSGMRIRIVGAILAGLVLAGCETISILDDEGMIRPGTAGLPLPDEGARERTTEDNGRLGGPIDLARSDRPEDDDAAVRPLEESELLTGSGTFTAPQISRARVSSESGQFSLNFANADVREVVDAVLGDALGLNYAVAPEVSGTITARTARPLTREQVIPALEDVLAMNGQALTYVDGLYRVVPLDRAERSAPVLIGQGASERGFGVHVIPLRHASGAALRETLETFIAPGRGLQVDSGRNLLLFRGPSAEARDIVDMVELFDVDWMAGMSFGLLPLENAPAEEVASELDILFGQATDGPMQGVISFLPIERMNAVLAISADSAQVARAEEWATRLDRGSAEGERQLYVYHVNNARATDLADVLGEVFDVRTVERRNGEGEVAPGRDSASIVDFGEPSGNGANGGDTPNRDTLRGRPDALGAGGGAGDNRRNRAGGADDSIVQGPRIIADAQNNALLVMADAGEYRMIESTLRRLDLVPMQVLIEATIAEVALTDQLRFGIRWFLEGTAGDTAISGTFSDLGTGAVASSFPGFSFVFDRNSARGVLNALAEITNVNVVSSPQLMVLDNQTARLQVGDQVPVATRSAVSITDPDAPIVNQIDFQDTGVILEVTPRVNASGLVTLQVRQEVSDVTETVTSNIDSPTIQQRSISSSVAVQTGETIALGGLIRDNRERSVSGVPLLMDIPGLGNLFRATDLSERRTELLVLLTPRVVRDQQESREVTQELRRRLHGLEALQDRIRSREEVPAQPEHAPEPGE